MTSNINTPIATAEQTYSRHAENRLNETFFAEIEGAHALVETFYHAFNNQDSETLHHVLAPHSSMQINNPLGGILRGHSSAMSLYQHIFDSPAQVWVEFFDIVEFRSKEMVVFAGRERGQYQKGTHSLDLSIRTTRVVQWMGATLGWRQTHHHGSIANPELLAAYQASVQIP